MLQWRKRPTRGRPSNTRRALLWAWRPGTRARDVPKGAAGEVARVLGCSNYYEVLELEKDAEAR